MTVPGAFDTRVESSNPGGLFVGVNRMLHMMRLIG